MTVTGLLSWSDVQRMSIMLIIKMVMMMRMMCEDRIKMMKMITRRRRTMMMIVTDEKGTMVEQVYLITNSFWKHVRTSQTSNLIFALHCSWPI